MRPSAILGLGLAIGASSVGAQSPAGSAESFLAMGIAQMEEGDFEAAGFTLDTAVRKFAQRPSPPKELALAYLCLGAAYVGLDHEDAAKEKFRQAISLDPDMRPAADRFSKRVLELFETERLRATALEKKRGAKLFLILGGAGAAGAVGIAAATRQTELPPNRPPTATVGVVPEGQAIAGVTVMRFAASAADPDGDPVTFTWDFGDGGLASGPTVTHVFTAAGAFPVMLTATDPDGVRGFASVTISAGTLTGPWRAAGSSVRYTCAQAVASLDCQSPNPGDEARRLTATLIDPRDLAGEFIFLNAPRAQITGRVSGDLRQMDLVMANGVFTRWARE